MYKVKEKYKNAVVRLTPPGKFGTVINLATATQEQLKYLYDIDSVTVYKSEQKKEKE